MILILNCIGEFQLGVLDENLVENADETHFIINMDNGKTLGFRGDDDVKYADVVSGGMGMTMVVRLTGGPGSTICAPFMIFQNQTARIQSVGFLMMYPVYHTALQRRDS
jgi:hypothetical protein